MDVDAGQPEEGAGAWREFAEFDAASRIRVPGEHDDKYSRGVLGVITGSEDYPGAAVLGVEAAVHTGIGMVRYLGPHRAGDLVLHARPEVVTRAGRVQAWLAGSGQDPATREPATTAQLDEARVSGRPVVLDAGALDLAGHTVGPAVLTPHAGELATLLTSLGEAVDRAGVTAHPQHWAARAADGTGCTVLLKGRVTHVCAPLGAGEDETARLAVRVTAPSSWAATAGSGDVLGGIVGALVAARADEVLADPRELVGLAATGAYVHAWAAERASAGGPLAALDIARAVPAVVARLVTGVRPA
ncbi:NAD(P)H-hydrate dehydratase [Herbiconiux moechotypicola]|nr:ADP/ATP-dependent (S)-NAD(P)H-hydrate dehydratase [Herbiconiux moechotypicola]MCS5728392.1 NAD(P)H-hydrate dehydratase [Herbiconiux moechotypicola]